MGHYYALNRMDAEDFHYKWDQKIIIRERVEHPLENTYKNELINEYIYSPKISISYTNVPYLLKWRVQRSNR